MHPPQYVSRFASFCLVALFALLASTVASAQDYTLTAGNESGFNGDVVQVSMTMNNLNPIRGYSYGVTHDASVVTLTGISQGAATMATHMGAGADFVHTDISPVGGPGGILAVLVSTDMPIEEIPAGMNQEIGVFTYSIVGNPGDTTALNFSAGLGSPTVPVVFSVAGVSNVPVTTSGSVDVLTPPVQNLMCTLVDPCTCDMDLTWTNPIAYTLVSVYIDGMLATTTTGTSATVQIANGTTSDICVIGTSGGLDSVAECCMVTCPPLPMPGPITGLTCVVGAACLTTLNWTNGGTYSAIDVLLDGVPQATLPGTATSTTLTLPSFSTFTICLVPADSCGGAVPQTCCMATCVAPPEFQRADANGDGNIDISDAVVTLGYMFLMKSVACVSALDVNDDGSVNLLDPIVSLDYQFTSGPPPAAPFGACGPDPTMDALTCVGPVPLCP